jgi:phosphoribosylanthranilate isomerase
MIDGIRIKVCGLTTFVDADFADKCGVDYLAFNLHPASPRRILLAQYVAMAPLLPDRKRVAVSVEPALPDLLAMRAAGFHFFQIHCRHDLPLTTVQAWSEAVGPDRLWLAPKLPPGTDVPAVFLPLAGHFLLDTFQADGFGGSGKTGDWAKFARHRQNHPDKTWILAGGLNPANIGEALRATGAKFIDVNSGVESAPGVKDQALLKKFIVAVHEAATKS